MVRRIFHESLGIRYLWPVLALILICGTGMAQKKPASIWASARFNKKTVTAGEPLVVTVTVYTSTWFTQPPVFSEIQVSGALMVRLAQRSGAKTVTIGRKQYPAIEQRFVVYPNIAGKNTLPPLEVVTTCPPEGGYKGITRTVETKPAVFEVLPPPEGADSSRWLTAYNLSLSETWDKPLKDIKAGDVLERRIRIRAGGALAALIPPLDIEKGDFGSVYPQPPILANVQNSASFSGSRTEIVNYLFEKDGSFELPELQLSWYNLRSRQLETARLPAIQIEVAANPDIEFILSRQQELQAELAEALPTEEVAEEDFKFLGLNWWQTLLLFLGLAGLGTIGVKWWRRFRTRRQLEKQVFQDSEAHYFQLLTASIEKADSRETVRLLYHWYDRYRAENYGPELRSMTDAETAEELRKILLAEAERFRSSARRPGRGRPSRRWCASRRRCGPGSGARRRPPPGRSRVLAPAPRRRR